MTPKRPLAVASAIVPNRRGAPTSTVKYGARGRADRLQRRKVSKMRGRAIRASNASRRAHHVMPPPPLTNF